VNDGEQQKKFQEGWFRERWQELLEDKGIREVEADSVDLSKLSASK
jgi:hypothetical protein